MPFALFEICIHKIIYGVSELVQYKGNNIRAKEMRIVKMQFYSNLYNVGNLYSLKKQSIRMQPQCILNII